jgi:hypothetical protein
MFQHFIGRVFVLDPPPEYQLDIVDIPVFTQGDETPLSLLMQVDEDDLTKRSIERLRRVFEQDDLPVALIRENAHIDPERQISAARTIRAQAQALHRQLGWTGFPDWDQLKATCKLIFREFVQRPTNGIFSGAQLAFRLGELRRANDVQQFISTILKRDNRIETPDEAVEAAFFVSKELGFLRFSPLPKRIRSNTA